ncbi:MAG: hypothetical protein COA45_01035 [Zetaproteobacteria bacterium]|nr:MAG: hypothetical protein COA45_01035 [Zetaproteobacteria bacterium]
MNFLRVVFLTFFIFSFSAKAGNISSTFGTSIFGVSWADNLDQVQAKYPDGKIGGAKGSRRYVVKDARDLMGLSFNKENEITYVFNQDILTHIDISFSEKGVERFGQLKEVLVAAFGNAQVTQPTSSVVMMKWHEDEGVTLSLFKSSGVFGGALHLNIQNTASSSEILSKRSLGFD